MKWVKSRKTKSWIPKISGFQTSFSFINTGCHVLFSGVRTRVVCLSEKILKSSLFIFNCSTEWILYTVLSGTWWPGSSQHTPLQKQHWVCRSDVCPSQLCHLSLFYMPLSSLLYDEGWTTPNRTERACFKRENAYAVIFKRLLYHVISQTFKCHSALRDADSERKKQKSGSEQSFIISNLDCAERGTVIAQRWLKQP